MGEPAITALIDYGSGNLASAAKALARVADAKTQIITTADPALIDKAERIVLPGVGAFADCMHGVCAITGMIEVLESKVVRRGTPFLGICVGMQLLASLGREFGEHKGLGWIKGEVVPVRPQDGRLKLPHMGWNQLHILRSHPLLAGINCGDHAYFVHSFEFKPSSEDDLFATTDYGGPLTAVVGHANIVGTQFHPEKSQEVGLRLLQNFLEWRP